jgi:hypothetical protein
MSALSRSLRRRLIRRHVSPYIWGYTTVIDPYMERLKRAALGDHVCQPFAVTVKENPR